MAGFDVSGFEKLVKDLEKLQKAMPATTERITKQLGARLLTLVIEKTPVGEYPEPEEITVVAQRNSKHHKKGDTYIKKIGTGFGEKNGGTLRRGWTATPITTSGFTCTVEIINPVEYAPYVEYGHRQTPGRYVPAIGKQLVRGWVPGRLMLTDSLEILKRKADKIIQEELDKTFREVFQ